MTPSSQTQSWSNQVERPELQHIFSLRCALSPEIIGPAADGLRMNFYVQAGEVEGPRLRGRMRPVGGDWLVIRRDGVGIIDVRCTLESDDNALIYGEHRGLVDLGAGGYERALSGKLPETLPARITARYHTAHPRYEWINRVQCVGALTIDSKKLAVRYDIYAMR